MATYKARFTALLAKYAATLEDATETFPLEVTKENIAEAKKSRGLNLPISCPLVHAALDPKNKKKDRLTAIEVMVGNKIANIIFENPQRGKGDKTYIARRYTLPKATQDMITIFDKTKIFEPGFYLFDVPSPGRRLDYVSKAKTGQPPRTYTKRDRSADPAAHVIPRDLSSAVA